VVEILKPLAASHVFLPPAAQAGIACQVMASAREPGPEPSPQQGISLDELAQAFAQVMGNAPPAKPPADMPAASPAVPLAGLQATAEAGRAPSSPAGPEDRPAAAPGEPAVDACPVTPRSILEAMLFVGDRENRPLSAVQAAEQMRGVEPSEIPGLVTELNRRYAAAGCPYEIIHDGEGYRISLRKPFFALRDRFYGRIREARLSQAAVDVLAIVAYQQPLTAEQVGTLRGKPSGHVLVQLVRRGLLRIERTPGERRAAQYSTTPRFLRLFGLQSLADLPQTEDLQRQ
jgi:segregation and condensation protein B